MYCEKIYALSGLALDDLEYLIDREPLERPGALMRLDSRLI